MKLTQVIYFSGLCWFLASCNYLNTEPTTLSIILSKQNSSNSCQEFIERLDTTLEWRWVDAYSLNDSELEHELQIASGIIMTGGVDIHPGEYGSAADTIRCGTIDLFRDRVEIQILEFVDSTKTPCLGVCRGLQIMNVHASGTLHPHLPDTLSEIHRGSDGATIHRIEITKSLGLFPIAKGDTANVVSNHHQGISRLGDKLEVWAVSEDGLAEGIRRTDTVSYPFYLGVQWHPERMGKGNLLSDPIGISFIEAILKTK
jgi:putative glutamine amidotransferase